MAERRKVDWREGCAVGGGECLVWVALWTLGGIGILLASALLAGASSLPAVFVPLIAGSLAMVGWGFALTVQHRPGLYLEQLTEDRRAALGAGWRRRLRLVAMASVQFAVLATVGYVALMITFN